MDEGRKKFLEAVKQGTNILVTVKRDPSIDGLAAAIGLSLILNGIGKHATAVFSGMVPPVLEFLDPDTTLHRNTDSLQDFIISLDKAKADKLRYKVEDQVVKIFITPYKTALTEKDLQFGQGDFNVDVVVALGVHSQEELDEAVTAHGRILHDATVVSLNADSDKVEDLGSVNWVGSNVCGLSQMVIDIADDLIGDNTDILDSQVATALLTGIVAETERYSNSKTTPMVMQASARLLEAGANQELVASKLAPSAKDEAGDEPAAEKPDEPEDRSGSGDGDSAGAEAAETSEHSEAPGEAESPADHMGGEHEPEKNDDRPPEDEPADKHDDSEENNTDGGKTDDKSDEGRDEDRKDDGDRPDGDEPPEDGGDGSHDAHPEDEPEQAGPADDSLHVDHQDETHDDKPDGADKEAGEEQKEHEPAGSTSDATPAVDVEEPAPAPADMTPAEEPAVPAIVLPPELTSELTADTPAEVPPQLDAEPQRGPDGAQEPAVPAEPVPKAETEADADLPSKYNRNERKHELVLQPLSTPDMPGVTDVHRTLTPENDPLDATSMLGSALQADASAPEAVPPYDMNRISVPASIPMAPAVIPASQAAWLPAPPAGAEYAQYPQPGMPPMQPMAPAASADAGLPSDEQAAMAILQQQRSEGSAHAAIQPLRDQYAFVGEPPLLEKKQAAAGGAPGKPVDGTLDPTKFALTPPTLGGTLTASHDSESIDLSTDPLSNQIIKHRPIMTHDPHELAAPKPGPDDAAQTDPESLPSGMAAQPHDVTDEPLAGVGHTITVPTGAADAPADPTAGAGSAIMVEPALPDPVPEPAAASDVPDLTAQLASATASLAGTPAGQVEGGPAPTLEAAVGTAEPEAPTASESGREADRAAEGSSGPAKPLEAAISNDEPQAPAENKQAPAEPEPEASSKPLEAAISNDAPTPEPKPQSAASEIEPEQTGPSKPLEAAISNDEPKAESKPASQEKDSEKITEPAGPSKPLEAALAA